MQERAGITKPRNTVMTNRLQNNEKRDKSFKKIKNSIAMIILSE